MTNDAGVVFGRTSRMAHLKLFEHQDTLSSALGKPVRGGGPQCASPDNDVTV